MILKIDRLVLPRALHWMRLHPADSEAFEMRSINLSRRPLADQSFHSFAARQIDASEVSANELCFEITENGAIADRQKTAFIEAQAAHGTRFSLGDFGSGNTYFSYLRQLPVDFIKIDSSLTRIVPKPCPSGWGMKGTDC